MRHLLGFRTFESVDGETYTSIPLHIYYSDLNDAVAKLKDLYLSNSSLSRIVAEFPSLEIVTTSYGIILQDVNFSKYSSPTVSMVVTLKIDIFELEDEWFYLMFNILDNRYAYKCDQMDGVFDCIRGWYSSFGK